jgi:hypothetical protein
MPARSPSLGRTTVRLACVVLVVVIALTIAELTSARFREFTGDHSLTSSFVTEAILLVGAYLVIDEIIERRGASLERPELVGVTCPLRVRT